VRSAGLQRQVIVLLAVAALAMIGLAVAGLVLVIAVRGRPDWTAVLPVGLALLGLILLWQAWSLSRDHFIALGRLKGAMVSLAGNTSARLPRLRDEAKPEIQGLHAALAALDARYAQERAAPDDRLQAVLASIPDALLVITDDGQVSLVNHAAKALLGAERVAVGSSVYAALSRTTVQSAMARAHKAGSPVDAMIGTLEEHQLTAKVAGLAAHGGAVITIPAEEVEFRAELDADLALHDVPPPPEAFATMAYRIVAEGERLDQIAAETIGNPEAFWQHCDANRAIWPEDLEAAGTELRLTLPEGVPGPGEET
jgi:DNA polymerase-3 subunit epsilon